MVAAIALAAGEAAGVNARATTQYASDNKFLILPVLTHEFGHVWGLCDQYEGANNCDPENSSSHLVLDSIMGSHGGTERLGDLHEGPEINRVAAEPGRGGYALSHRDALDAFAPRRVVFATRQAYELARTFDLT